MSHKMLRRLRLPAHLTRRSLLFFDRKLVSKVDPSVYGGVYSVAAGESLKSLESFSNHMNKILRLFDRIEPKEPAIIGLGGGSVGDFAGFIASVLKRGVPYYAIPSTWLAAIDSAHGGKTAMNIGVRKNQIGSFYPAETVFLVSDLLQSQPVALTAQAFAELVKVSVINDPELFRSLESQDFSPDRLYRELPRAIDAKMRVVRRDPKERSGIRHKLNLGHTMGHVIEGRCQIPHGEAVSLGLEFAAHWSVQRGMLTPATRDRILRVLHKAPRPKRELNLRKSEIVRSLKADKKRRGRNVRFIFIRRVGQVAIAEVTPEQVAREWERQRESI